MRDRQTEAERETERQRERKLNQREKQSDRDTERGKLTPPPPSNSADYSVPTSARPTRSS